MYGRSVCFRILAAALILCSQTDSAEEFRFLQEILL